jgi:hypothetical protein
MLVVVYSTGGLNPLPENLKFNFMTWVTRSNAAVVPVLVPVPAPDDAHSLENFAEFFFSKKSPEIFLTTATRWQQRLRRCVAVHSPGGNFTPIFKSHL